MTDMTSYIEMLRKFGSDIGLPRLSVDNLLETQKKNIDALSQSTKIAVEGAQSVAQKQRKVLEAGLREAATLVREYKPFDQVRENLTLQTEFAGRILEIALKETADSATTAQQSTAEAIKIIQDRVKENLEEIRSRMGRNKSA